MLVIFANQLINISQMQLKTFTTSFLIIIFISNALVQAQLLHPYKLKTIRESVVYIDLDNDGDPDILKTLTNDSIPILWIDDDDDMMKGDLEGDLDNDCLMIDRDKNGQYGSFNDFIVDRNDEDGNGQADMEIIADNDTRENRGWEPGHFMIVIDTDHDGVFNNINWNTFTLEAWDHIGNANFFTDYSGNTMFIKAHNSTFNVKELAFNWENPFLFYDSDNDGLTEYAIRFADNPVINTVNPDPLPGKNGHITSEHGTITYKKRIDDVRITFDLDNDNDQNNEFDFDLSLKFSGKGIDYQNNKHVFNSMRGLPDADSLFYDLRWRAMTELYYIDHENAYSAIFRGDWQEAWFVFDEDDDCHRWERVEFYDPKNMFRIGHRNGGLDNNPQADASGDRGEWDLDFSGKGNLYIGAFDGRLHLHGAEWGAWRIDQNALYYQGWQGWRGGEDTIPHDHFVFEPEHFPSIKYIDTDKNQFIDQINYDLDGDTIFELSISLLDLGIDDKQEVIEIENIGYEEFKAIYSEMADAMWEKANHAIKIAKQNNINTGWYAKLMNPANSREKYYKGYWLNLYLYLDLREKAIHSEDAAFVKAIDKAYHSGNWNGLP